MKTKISPFFMTSRFCDQRSSIQELPSTLRPPFTLMAIRRLLWPGSRALFVLEGRKQRLACITFWTTSAKFKGRGYGSRVWMEILRRARDSGYDGAVNFCVDGAPTNAIVMACGERVNAEVYRVFSTKYLARLLRPAPMTKTVASPQESWIYS